MSAKYDKGVYLATVQRQYMGQSKEKNTPYFALEVIIEARVFPGNDVQRVDRNPRTVYMYLTDATIEFVTEQLAFIGYDNSSLAFLDPEKPGFHNFEGKEIELWCGHGTYKGETQEKWSISVPREPPAPLDPKALRSLDALFGKAMRTKKPKSESPAEQVGSTTATLEPAPGSGPPKTPDEIPF